MGGRFSFNRFRALLAKEFIQACRDRLTFAMMVGMPVIQLILFGYAINSDPKHLPAAVISADHGEIARSIVAALENSGYFKIVGAARDRGRSRSHDRARRGAVRRQHPGGFHARVRPRRAPGAAGRGRCDRSRRDRQRGRRPCRGSIDSALLHDLEGPLRRSAGPGRPFEIRVHRRYNPEGVTQYNIVPGLLGRRSSP